MYTDYTNFDQVLSASNLTADQFEQQTKSDTADEKGYKKVKLITKAINGDWAPDWNNRDQFKYEIWWDMRNDDIVFSYVNDWNLYSLVGSRLCFGKCEWAEYAAKTFKAEFREFLR